MSRLKRLVPSPSLVIAGVALLLVLGGTAYAATKLPRNSVTTVQVKNHSLLARDFKAGQLPRGPAGPPGPAGPAGAAGPSGAASIKWALVRPDGGIAAQSGGITLAAKPSAGTYILRIGSTVTGKAVIASAGYAGDSSGGRETSAGPCGGGAQGRTCPTSNNTSTIIVQTRSSTGASADHSFYVAVFG
jgi:hypothetical protein